MARELLQEMARYWQMRVEEIRTLAGFAGRMDDVEAAEIMLRIAGGYDRLVQKSRRCGRSNRGRRQIIQFVIYIRSNVFLQLRGLAR